MSSNQIKSQYIAVLFTGQIRTLEKTIHNFQKNILENNPNHTIHVYAVLEYPHELDNQYNQDKQQYIQKYEQIFQQFTHTHLKKIHWLSSQDEGLKNHKTQVLENLHISDGWKDYLGNRSGSISEYYQLNIGIKMIQEYEQEQTPNQKYDYFMRTRCDIMIPNPIPFDPLGENNETLQKRYQAIQQIYPQANAMGLFCYFIESLKYLFPFPPNPRFMLDVDPNYHEKYLLEAFLPEHIQDITEVFQPFSETHDPKGYTILDFPYLTVHRQNLLYVSKTPIVCLQYIYRLPFESKYIKGSKSSNMSENNFWFNSENMYISHVLEKEKKIYVNSYTKLEESSLYEYHPDNYNPPASHLLFYLCRN
jgi:hypothetical protein